jgi:hypothetical protein
MQRYIDTTITRRHDNTQRHDNTRHNTTRHDTTRHNTTRNDTTRHDTTRQDTTRYNKTQRHDKTRRHDKIQKRDDMKTRRRCCQCPCALTSLYVLQIYLNYEQGLKPFELGGTCAGSGWRCLRACQHRWKSCGWILVLQDSNDVTLAQC